MQQLLELQNKTRKHLLDMVAQLAMQETRGSIPGLGRSPREGNGNPLQYSYLKNSIDRGAWWATVHGVTKSRTRLSGFTLQYIFQSYFMDVTFCYFCKSIHDSIIFFKFSLKQTVSPNFIHSGCGFALSY